MKHSQIAKTSDTIEFVNEEDRVKFTKIVVDLIKDVDFKKQVSEKQKKYKGSFTVKWFGEELKELGIEPYLSLKFKKVKNSDEWDVDIHLDKLRGIQSEEYFNRVECK